jgi:ParB-like chromosome segregation protein Spo0J
MKTSSKSTGLINATKFDANTVYTPKQAEVFVDVKWNSRSAPDEGDATKETTGYTGLVKSIGTEGLRSPVVLRPNPNYGKKGMPGASCPYSLVSGFSRFKACASIAAGEQDVTLGQAGMTQAAVAALHTNTPTIRAFIRPMTEAEARKENLTENLQRQDLTAPDIAFGVARLRDTMPEASDQQIADIIGRSQQYCSKLKRLYEGLKNVMLPAGALSLSSPAVPLLDAWRTEAKKGLFTNDDILAIAEAKDANGVNLPQAEKAARYLAVVRPPVDGEGSDGKKDKGPGAWKGNAAKDAEAFGVLLGNLERDGAIEIHSIGSEHAATVAAKYAAKMLAKGTEDDLDMIAAACEKGIKRGRKKAVAAAPPAGQPVPTDATPPKVAAAMTARGKKANGKAAATA